MTTVRAQPQDKTAIVPVGNHTCPDQIHVRWGSGGGGEHHGGSVHLKCQWMHPWTNFSARSFPRQRPARQPHPRHLQTTLKLNAGDKERCLEDPSDVHPHAT